VIKGESYPGDLTSVSDFSYCHVVCLVRCEVLYVQFERVMSDLADGPRRSMFPSLRAPEARAFLSRARFLACVPTHPPSMTQRRI